VPAHALVLELPEGQPFVQGIPSTYAFAGLAAGVGQAYNARIETG
jgi:hypothetical protein